MTPFVSQHYTFTQGRAAPSSVYMLLLVSSRGYTESVFPIGAVVLDYQGTPLLEGGLWIPLHMCFLSPPTPSESPTRLPLCSL